MPKNKKSLPNSSAIFHQKTVYYSFDFLIKGGVNYLKIKEMTCPEPWTIIITSTQDEASMWHAMYSDVIFFSNKTQAM